MIKDILFFNKQGGVGIEVSPVEDLLTTDGNFNLSVFDTNGNPMYHRFTLGNPRSFYTSDNYKKYKIFEEVVDEIPEGYSVINVPSSNVLYVFTNADKDSVLVDTPIANINNICISDNQQYTGIYAVKINNTSESATKIYYKNCDYAEVIL